LTLPELSGTASPATANATLTNAATDDNATGDRDFAILQDDSFPIGPVVGGIGGFLVLVLLVALLVWWLLRKRAQAPSSSAPETASSAMQDVPSINDDVDMPDETGMTSPRDEPNYGPIAIVAPANDYELPPTMFANEYDAPNSAL